MAAQIPTSQKAATFVANLPGIVLKKLVLLYIFSNFHFLRYGKGWGFGGGQDSAKSTRSTRSRRASTKSNRRNASRLRREDSNESNDSRGHSGKSRYGSSRSRVGSAQSRRSFRGSRSVDSGRSRGYDIVNMYINHIYYQ